MEGIHGVDVSWLHHSNIGKPTRIRTIITSGIRKGSNKDTHEWCAYSPEHHHRFHAPSSPGLTRDVPPPTSSHGGIPKLRSDKPAAVPPPQPPTLEKVPEDEDLPPDAPSTPSNSPPAAKSKQSQSPNSLLKPARPGLLARHSAEKVTQAQNASDNNANTSSTRRGSWHPESGKFPSRRGNADPSKSSPRRGSWITNLSSKFSSQNQGQPQSSASNAPTPPPAGSKATATNVESATNGSKANGNPGSSPSSPTNSRKQEDNMTPYVPQQPKPGGGSFFSSALKRLSSGNQMSPSTKTTGHGGVCPRKILNVDSQRPRCLVPELDDSKLRRVAFSVDVEIAGGPRWLDDERDPDDKKKKAKGLKMKEKGEGAALKNPQAAATEAETDGAVKTSGENASNGNENEPTPEEPSQEDAKEISRRKEKKRRSEEERKERKERRRRRAEESGAIPVEVSRDPDDSTSGSTSASGSPQIGTSSKSQARPTTDPVRIYRRCCQLRETPVLKRITEQLSSPSTCALDTPGVVGRLDLTGSRLQLADVVTLGDWLAVVPVKRLLLEDADLTDEGVRVILSGLLAAKPPVMTSRNCYGRSNLRKAEDRTGVVEKLVLKNNPRITKLGWKHISLFLNMCRSIKAIDVSMVPFPNSSVADQSKISDNITEIFAKAISERLAGANLEELIMAECRLTAPDIRRIVDAVTMSGLRRLGLAGNRLDNEGLDYVLRFVQSGACQGLDIGGNDMRDRLDRLANALTDKSDLWALCLANCNLSPESLKRLFPALVRLPHFKFIDLSHNRDLFSTDPSALGILRKYIPQMQEFKRLHLVDVSMSPAQAISLAEILPEGPHLAHLNILENPQLSALASAKDEASQEEACALYASLMAAARVSDTIICIDIDVPSYETNEVVKALAKQVVAYCLRNIQRWAPVESTETADAKAALSEPHEREIEVSVPDVLMHLVGHVDGFYENHDNDDPAPDDDYIVGGTGVVKALSYVLGEKAKNASLPTSGTATPKDHVKSAETGKGKAMNMSRNLLDSARKIRARLHPALVKEAKAGDEIALRKFTFPLPTYILTNSA